ncbi:AraC family transcriptional regulator [Chryseobacterium indoltheticum]|uniref:Transcriptional activator RhaS n=1 Tax=Chryseobacterium indoltheticum TaxID=254 RepID=A0A381FQR2_9FLAO|nr:AraC family transcriptional regulator [Chryseobacterium indoltheticum]SUX48935.1 transcriptional activator RhaS [Chryseobacterium indoltheticum]
MAKFKQFNALEILDFKEIDFHLMSHGQNYYELVYIYSGMGIHQINRNQFSYTSGDLFLISPDDEHNFIMDQETRVICIKFTDDYFSSKDHWKLQDYMTYSPESIMTNKILKEIKLDFDLESKTILLHTIDNILIYNNTVKSISTSPIVFYQILSLFGIIKEAMMNMSINYKDHLPEKEQLISYIHQHIYEPEIIKIKRIALHFNIATTYFSAYFKRNFQMGYRAYINRYKISLIEKRLESGQFTLKQISDEFGFIDESHFSHFYKNNKGISPSYYSSLRRT